MPVILYLFVGLLLIVFGVFNPDLMAEYQVQHYKVCTLYMAFAIPGLLFWIFRKPKNKGE